MKEASPFRTILIVAFLALLFAITVKFFEAKTDKSDINKLVNTLQNTKPSSGDGILPSSPIEAIKQIEQYLKGQSIKDTKIDYSLTIDYGKNREDYNFITNIASNPFRWRIDFSDVKESFQTIFINDGSKYYSCNSSEKTCRKFLSLDELSFPIPLTGFLNVVLDPLMLKKFVGKTPETSIKTIANNSTNCLKSSDGNEEVEICTDKVSSAPLLVFVKRNFDEYTLEAKKVNISTLSANTFSPLYPLLDAE